MDNNQWVEGCSVERVSGRRVYSLGKKEVQLSPNERKMGYFYEMVSPIQKRATLHTILLIDGSSLMAAHLEDLKDLVTETVKSIGKKHKLSLLLFGGEGELIGLIEQATLEEPQQIIDQLHRQLEECCGDGECVLSEALAEVFLWATQRSSFEKMQVIIVTTGHLYSKRYPLSIEWSRCYGWMLDLFSHHVMTYVVGMGNCYLPFLVRLAKTGQTGDFYPYCEAIRYRRRLKRWISCLKTQENRQWVIENQDYFLMGQTNRVRHPKRIEQVSQLIVTFDGALSLEGELIKINPSVISESMEEQFRLAYSYYLLKHRFIHEASQLLRETSLFSVVYEGYSVNELKQSLVYLDEGASRHQISDSLNSRFSVFDVLKRLLDDPFTQLYYRAERPLVVSDSRNDLCFTASFLGKPARVVTVKASQTKMNVYFTVKLCGVVQKNHRDAKREAYVYRTYDLIKNGELVQKTLTCRLSHKLRQELKQNGIFLKPCPFDASLDEIDLSCLKLTHFQIIPPDASEKIAKGLYELEVLSTKETLLKCLRQHQPEYSEKRAGYKGRGSREYRVNGEGVFIPARVEAATLKMKGYEGDVICWGIENFNRYQVAQRCYEDICQTMLLTSEPILHFLNREIQRVRQRRLGLSNEIYFFRMQTLLCGQSIFNFEKRNEKKRQHRRYGAIKQSFSQQKIGDLVVFENKQELFITF